MTERIENHPVLPEPPAADDAKFTFNGESYVGRTGEPVAAALLAAGVRELRTSPVAGEPRGLYCGIGHCYECRLWLGPDEETAERVRGCQAPISDGDTYRSTRGCDS
ncbi:MAG: 2Fe-2S iron-sulfur cluster-binding protein [Leucobacter sp.]